MLERIASSEEKIRRAEEIYYRRKSQNGRNRNIATVNVNNEKNYGLLKKLILQVLICLVIYFIFYIVQNSNYIFSEDVLTKTQEILSYDINIKESCQQVMQYLQQATQAPNQQEQEQEPQEQPLQTESPKTEEQPQEETNQEEKTTSEQENSQDTNQQDDTATVKEEENTVAIGGADFEDVIMQNSVPKTQDELDIEYLKTFSWIKPVSGRVTSEFGTRESSNPIVGSNHTGIDIGANTGTVIVASTAGTVTISSTVGEYGQHIKITNNDVSTLYAHCSKLYVKEGEHIEQGQPIAEVGSTGKSTRATFTF